MLLDAVFPYTLYKVSGYNVFMPYQAIVLNLLESLWCLNDCTDIVWREYDAVKRGTYGFGKDDTPNGTVSERGELCKQFGWGNKVVQDLQ